MWGLSHPPRGVKITAVFLEDREEFKWISRVLKRGGHWLGGTFYSYHRRGGGGVDSTVHHVSDSISSTLLCSCSWNVCFHWGNSSFYLGLLFLVPAPGSKIGAGYKVMPTHCSHWLVERIITASSTVALRGVNGAAHFCCLHSLEQNVCPCCDKTYQESNMPACRRPPLFVSMLLLFLVWVLGTIVAMETTPHHKKRIILAPKSEYFRVEPIMSVETWHEATLLKFPKCSQIKLTHSLKQNRMFFIFVTNIPCFCFKCKLESKCIEFRILWNKRTHFCLRKGTIVPHYKAYLMALPSIMGCFPSVRLTADRLLGSSHH